MKNGGKNKSVAFIILFNVYIRGVNFNALTHVINLKNFNALIFFLTQINHLIRFDPNFFPSSQRGRLSISV